MLKEGEHIELCVNGKKAVFVVTKRLPGNSACDLCIFDDDDYRNEKMCDKLCLCDNHTIPDWCYPNLLLYL